MLTISSFFQRAAQQIFLLGFFAALISPLQVVAQTAEIDPRAVQLLKASTSFLDSLKQFSVHTQNTLEDVLDSGQRVDLDISASVIVSRPHKLRVERRGELLDQVFYYNGNTLTLYNPSDRVSATESVPGTIEEMLNYAHDSLGLVFPVADLVYHKAFQLLMHGVSSATVVGKAEINGVTCDHLAFSRGDVDFQIWIADRGQPLPCKYVVTDKSTLALMSISTVMSDWNVAPTVADASFTFVPPEGVTEIVFVPFNPGESK